MHLPLALLISVLCCTGCASTQVTTGSQTIPEVDEAPEPIIQPVIRPDPNWAPPEPDETQDDWVQLISGEWLRGEVDVLRSDTLEFDSEELDLLKIDWEDVIEVRTTRLMTLGLTDSRIVTGTLLVKGDDVVVGGARVMRFDRHELLSIISGEPTEANYWSGKLSMGVIVRKGNTDQVDGSGDFQVLRRTPDSRVSLSYNGAFTKVESVETSNSHRMNGKWDRFLTRRFYVSPFFFEAFQDRFQNIDSRITPGAGAGYQIVDRGGLEWKVDGGLGYQILRYDSVEAGEPTGQDSTAVLFGTALDTDLTKRTELLLEYSLQWATAEEVGVDQHARLVLSVDLIGELELDVSFIWDRVGKPVADEDGIFPENDDYRLQVGFGWNF